MSSHLVLSHMLPELRKMVDSFNRKAERYGTAPVKLGIGAPFLHEIETSYQSEEEREVYGTEKVHVEVCPVEIDGEVPRVKGWEFVVTVTGFDGEVRQLSKSPGFKGKVPVRYRTTDCHCDHCQINTQRKDVFVLRNTGSGNFKQIGRNCLRDFLGTTDVLQIIKFLDRFEEFVRKVGEEDEFNGRGKPDAWQHAGETVLAHALTIIGRYGYVKASGRQGVPENIRLPETTKAKTFHNIHGKKEYDRQGNLVWEPIKPTDEAKAKAKVILEWYGEWQRSRPVERRTDFEHSMLAAIQYRNIGSEAHPVMAWMVHDKGFGISCYLAEHYHREMARDGERKAKHAELAASEYVGEPGKRLDLRLKISRVTGVEGSYGYTLIHSMADEKGNQYVWFATRRLDDELGVWMNVRATVKRHSERNGIKQTVLTRVALAKEKASEHENAAHPAQ